MSVCRAFRCFPSLILLVGVFTTWGQSGPIDVGSQKQLFIDDHVIDSLQGVYRLMNQPLKYAANPIIQMDRCWEADMHFGNSPNLAYDPDRGVYQM